MCAQCETPFSGVLGLPERDSKMPKRIPAFFSIERTFLKEKFILPQ